MTFIRFAQTLTISGVPCPSNGDLSSLILNLGADIRSSYVSRLENSEVDVTVSNDCNGGEATLEITISTSEIMFDISFLSKLVLKIDTLKILPFFYLFLFV